MYVFQAEWNDSGGSAKTSRTVPYPSELPRTIHMIRIKFTEFPRIDSGRPFLKIRGWRYVLADRHPNRCRTLRKYSRIITYHYISMSYGPNLTNKFAIPHVCLYHVYVPTVHSCPNELYNSRGNTHVTIKVTVQFEHEWRYITYPPVPFVQNVLLGSLSNPKNCHLGIKVAESAIPHRIFWLLYEKWHTRWPEKPKCL